MLATLREWRDQLLGRGNAAITVPVMDGALKPNRALDEAAVVAELAGLDDIAANGRQLLLAAGTALWRLDGDTPVELRRFDAALTAVALSVQGRVAVALGGRRVLVLDEAGAEIARLDTLGAERLHSVNAIAFDGEAALLVSDGSLRFAPAQWCHDLMTRGRTGRVARWRLGSGAVEMLAQGQRYAFGVLALGDAVLHSESWRHHVVRTDARGPWPVVAELPGYPSRMSAATGGGFWLTCFVCRTQLVEFVLREDAYRRRMVAEIDPRYWIAPALSSGQSFLEPLQGAGVKSMGVLKPWAPPRSYGLVMKVAADGRIERSLHSLVDGQHHGMTAVAEHGGALYAVSKGSGRLLKVALR
jgi:hypothetical protein